MCSFSLQQLQIFFVTLMKSSLLTVEGICDWLQPGFLEPWRKRVPRPPPFVADFSASPVHFFSCCFWFVSLTFRASYVFPLVWDMLLQKNSKWANEKQMLKCLSSHIWRVCVVLRIKYEFMRLQNDVLLTFCHSWVVIISVRLWLGGNLLSGRGYIQRSYNTSPNPTPNPIQHFKYK